MQLNPTCSSCGAPLSFNAEQVHVEGDQLVFVRVEPHACGQGPETRTASTVVAGSREASNAWSAGEAPRGAVSSSR